MVLARPASPSFQASPYHVFLRSSPPEARRALGRLGLEALEARALLSGNPPTANPDSDSTDEATAKNIDVLANDIDPENDVLTFSNFDATSAKGATVTLNPGGTLRYDPSGSATLNALAAGEMTTDTFSYTVKAQVVVAAQAVWRPAR